MKRFLILFLAILPIFLACDKQIIQKRKDIKKMEGTWQMSSITQLNETSESKGIIPESIELVVANCRITKRNRQCPVDIVLNDGKPFHATLSATSTAGKYPDATAFRFIDAEENDFFDTNTVFVLKEINGSTMTWETSSSEIYEIKFTKK